MKMLDTALRAAAARDQAGLVRFLIMLRANPYAADAQGRTPFNRAASNGLRALAALTEIAFLDTQKPDSKRRWKQYNVNTPSGCYGSTLITYAAKVCDAPLIKAMIEAGADIRIINGSGWTLLHCAAVMPGRLEVLKMLLNALRTRGYDDLINARSTHIYETEYDGHTVIYPAGLTAAELCHERIKQDPGYPKELARYQDSLTR